MTPRPDHPHDQTRSDAMNRRDYLRGRRRASLPVYFRDESAKARAQERAAAMGYASCSAWILQMVETATSGQVYPPEYVTELKSEVERLKRWVEQKDEQIASLSKDLRVVEMQKDDLYTVIAGLPTRSPSKDEDRSARKVSAR